MLTGQESYYFGILRFLSLLGEQWQYNQALREKLTENCIIVVNALSGGLGPDEKIHLIRATAEIDESKLTKEFVSAISTIAVEMTFQQKIKLIEAMKDVNKKVTEISFWQLTNYLPNFRGQYRPMRRFVL